MAGRWERTAGIAGVIAFALFVATFFTPSTPDVGIADSAIGAEIAADRSGLMLGSYLLGLAALALLVFATGLASRLRRAEGDAPGASLLALVGAAVMTAVMFVSIGVTIAFVSASHQARDAVALRALFELDEVMFLPAGFAFAAFLGGVALSAVQTGALPRWLAWSAGVLALGYVVSLLGLLSADDEGGPLGIVYFVDLMLTQLWVLAAAVVLVRGAAPERSAARAETPRQTVVTG